jgi:hypothetical protein
MIIKTVAVQMGIALERKATGVILSALLILVSGKTKEQVFIGVLQARGA